MIRVQLPAHLRTLAGLPTSSSAEVLLEVEGVATIASVLDALEARFPMLCGTIRDHTTLKRRAFLRFFACETDISHEPHNVPLPASVASGQEPLLIIGAIAGG